MHPLPRRYRNQYGQEGNEIRNPKLHPRGLSPPDTVIGRVLNLARNVSRKNRRGRVASEKGRFIAGHAAISLLTAPSLSGDGHVVCAERPPRGRDRDHLWRDQWGEGLHLGV